MVTFLLRLVTAAARLSTLPAQQVLPSPTVTVLSPYTMQLLITPTLVTQNFRVKQVFLVCKHLHLATPRRSLAFQLVQNWLALLQTASMQVLK